MRVADHLSNMHKMAAESHIAHAKLTRSMGHEFHKLAAKFHKAMELDNGAKENGDGDNGEIDSFDVLGDLCEECAKAHIAKADYHLRAGDGITQKAAGLADNGDGLEDLRGISGVYPHDNSSVKAVLRHGQREIPNESGGEMFNRIGLGDLMKTE